MRFLASVSAFVAFLAPTAFAANLTRSECLCSTSGLIAYSVNYTLTTPSLQNGTIIATDTCTSAIMIGACSLDTTFLKDITGTLEVTVKQGYTEKNVSHTFKYNRELFEADKYALDGSGWKKVPAKKGHEVGDVKVHCDKVCKELDQDLKENCGRRGTGCKAQWFDVPDL